MCFRVADFLGNWRSLWQLAKFLSSKDGPVHSFTLPSCDIDSFIEPIVVFRGRRMKMEQEDIPEYFWPTTGQWRMRGMCKIFLGLRKYKIWLRGSDLHKIFVDDDSYNSGHGHAYEKYDIGTKEGAVVVVRPDQCVLIRFKFCNLLLTLARCLSGNFAQRSSGLDGFLWRLRNAFRPESKQDVTLIWMLDCNISLNGCVFSNVNWQWLDNVEKTSGLESRDNNRSYHRSVGHDIVSLFLFERSYFDTPQFEHPSVSKLDIIDRHIIQSLALLHFMRSRLMLDIAGSDDLLHPTVFLSSSSKVFLTTNLSIIPKISLSIFTVADFRDASVKSFPASDIWHPNPWMRGHLQFRRCCGRHF